MNLQSHRTALPILYFWISDPTTFLLKTVLFLWEFEGSIFMKVVVGVSKIILELESLENDFYTFSYEFPKLLICCSHFWKNLQ